MARGELANSLHGSGVATAGIDEQRRLGAGRKAQACETGHASVQGSSSNSTCTACHARRQTPPGGAQGAPSPSHGCSVRVLVHRKGATRAFAPHHPLVPEKYRASCAGMHFGFAQLGF